MLYFLIAFMATTIGSITGIGGGLIIKPLLSVSTNINVENITIISSITILAMSGTTILKNSNDRKNVIDNFYYIVGGSLIGGVVGNKILGIFIDVINDNAKSTIIQSIMLICILLFILLSKKIRHIKPLNPGAIKLFVLGILLGSISAFLGIGGGLLNVAMLTIFFNLDLKMATFTSIFIIFFSQFSNIATYIITGSLWQNNLHPVLFTIPAAIIGGLFGSRIKKKLRNDQIKFLYSILLIFLIFLNTMTVILLISNQI